MKRTKKKAPKAKPQGTHRDGMRRVSWMIEKHVKKAFDNARVSLAENSMKSVEFNCEDGSVAEGLTVAETLSILVDRYSAQSHTAKPNQ